MVFSFAVPPACRVQCNSRLIKSSISAVGRAFVSAALLYGNQVSDKASNDHFAFDAHRDAALISGDPDLNFGILAFFEYAADLL
jgi:hypothetical protein